MVVEDTTVATPVVEVVVAINSKEVRQFFQTLYLVNGRPLGGWHLVISMITLIDDRSTLLGYGGGGYNQGGGGGY